MIVCSTMVFAAPREPAEILTGFYDETAASSAKIWTNCPSEPTLPERRPTDTIQSLKFTEAVRPAAPRNRMISFLQFVSFARDGGIGLTEILPPAPPGPLKDEFLALWTKRAFQGWDVGEIRFRGGGWAAEPTCVARCFRRLTNWP